MAKLITPLAMNVPIVDDRGNPTPYFQRILEEISDAKISASVIDAMGGDPGGDRVVVWDDTANDLSFMTTSEVLDFVTGASHGDILYRDSTGWETLGPGTAGQLLQTNGAGADPTWVTPDRYCQIHLFGSNTAAVLINVNSVTYVNPGHPVGFNIDRTAFPFTHYRIVMRAASNAAGNSVLVQLAHLSTPTTPAHTGGDDMTFPNANTTVDTGWLTFDLVATGLWNGGLCMKGTNATVDLNVVGACDIMFKIDS